MTVAQALEDTVSSAYIFMRTYPYGVGLAVWVAGAFVAVASGLNSLVLLPAVAMWVFATAVTYNAWFAGTLPVALSAHRRIVMWGVVITLSSIAYGIEQSTVFGAGLDVCSMLGLLTVLLAAGYGFAPYGRHVFGEEEMRYALSVAGGAGSLVGMGIVWGGAPFPVELLFLCAFCIIACVGLWHSRSVYVRVGVRLSSVVIATCAILGMSALLSSVPTAQERVSVGQFMHAVASLYSREPITIAIGTGPGTFSDVWNKHRPEGVNETLLWDSIRGVPPNALLGIVVEYGFPSALFIGTLALYCLYLAAVPLVSSRMLREARVAVAVLVVMLLAPMPTVSFPVWALTVFLLARGVETGGTRLPLSPSAARVLRVGGLTVFLATAIIATVLFQRALAFGYAEAAHSLLARGEAAKSLRLFERSMSIMPIPEVLAAYADVHIGAAQAVADSARENTEQLQSFLDKAETAAGRARKEGPRTLQWQLLYANTLLMRAAVLGDRSPGEVYAAYGTAVYLAPQHPVPYLLLAHAELLLGDENEARRSLYRAALLKNDIHEIDFIRNQLDVARSTK